MALDRGTYAPPSPARAGRRVGGRGRAVEAPAWAGVEARLVQILVVVAITQVRYLWAEEEKGLIRTVIGYELVDPK